MLSPEAWVEAYTNVRVSTLRLDGQDIRPGLLLTVPITGYANASEPSQAKRNKADRALQDWLTHGHGRRLVSISGSQVTLLIADPIFTTLGTISRVFHGKGTPDEIRDVLRLASLWISAEEASSPQRLLTRDISSFARQFIGVDCNGFVGTYLRENHPGTHFGAQFYIPGDNPFR